MKIELPGLVVERHSDHILTTFDDGASSANWPHPDDPSYVLVARQCGFTDLMTYCFAHEVCHSLVPRRLFEQYGYVVWMAAHGRKMNLAAAMMEERMFFLIQRAAAGGVVADPAWRPIIRELDGYGLCGSFEISTKCN